MIFSPQQEQAIAAVRAWLADPQGPQVFYLAGYAGTGKTTIAKALAGEVREVCFAAFTGKASLVLRGKGCANASTIHSLIYSPVEDDDGRTMFVLNPDSKASTADLIVIDEVSMVGAELGRDLLSFGTRVLVLGDPAQLPPVGDGTGFFTARPPDFMLTEIHRQAAENPIIRLATTVRQGGRLEFGEYGTSAVIPRAKVGQKVALGVDQVLCGKNDTRRTTNAKIRRLLGREGFFVEGERVVALRNNKNKGLLNGSIWSIAGIDYSDADESHLTIRALDAGMTTVPVDIKTHHAWLTGREKELPWGIQREFDPVDYAYCLSVHKAQGSQWDSVLVLDESRVFREDAAKHLYTALTRAAERVIVAI